MMDTTVEELGRLTILSPDGNEVEMATLWAERPAVLAMIRHFG